MTEWWYRWKARPQCTAWVIASRSRCGLIEDHQRAECVPGWIGSLQP